MIRQIKEKILAIFGSITGIFGFIGLMGWCCAPLVIGFFALFGITSTAFLITYNWLFLVVGIITLTSAGFFYWKRIQSKNKCCKNKLL